MAGNVILFFFPFKRKGRFFRERFLLYIRRREGFFARTKDSDFGKRHAPVSGPGSFPHRKKISRTAEPEPRCQIGEPSYHKRFAISPVFV
ncbi:MAG: hypothetical protein C6P37_05915 [Caldibacillus debilis]|uniref:Uncharacterized protein n=1 Tax=Caldibacillus debilis TaxID=301148 RepID=A0A3E0K6Z4_9BACI|nr:hypothetical protein [Bacillaceae bacterium]REJ29474.1 MAG: hypothetical protein C6P37_05915 [Caldibacillus debilis]